MGFCLTAVFVSAQPAHPVIDDFASATSLDEKVAEAALGRIASQWKDDYAALFIDLARFYRPLRSAGPGTGGDEGTIVPEDESTSGGPPSRNGSASFPTAPRDTPGAKVRARLIRFLEKQTKQKFGDDLKAWRKWMWKRPYAPHPDYAQFKARLYANIDERMASFFPPGVRAEIRLDEIDWGGVAVNGIPPLDHPKVAPATDDAATKYLGEKNVVFGLVVNGEARAYPKRILAWHEMAQDRVGGVELAVVYCTLCGTVIPYEAQKDEKKFTLGTSGLLYRSNKLMFDLETKSLWSTLEGKPVVGPLVGSGIELKYYPVVTTTWKEWKTAHPETSVLTLETGHKRDYGEGVAYRSYFDTDRLMFEVPASDERLKNKDEVVTFFAEGHGGSRVPVALSAAFLKKSPAYVFEAGGRNFIAITTEQGANRIYAGAPRLTATAAGALRDDRGREWRATESSLETEGESYPRIPARRTFWFAWFAQFPNTILVR